MDNNFNSFFYDTFHHHVKSTALLAIFSPLLCLSLQHVLGDHKNKGAEAASPQVCDPLSP